MHCSSPPAAVFITAVALEKAVAAASDEVVDSRYGPKAAEMVMTGALRICPRL